MLAARVALVSILANILFVAVHALDGSAEADRLDALGHAIHEPLTRQHHLIEQAAVLNQPIATIGREAGRMAAAGITAAGHELANADRLIDAGRAVNQSTGPLSEPAVNPTTWTASSATAAPTPAPKSTNAPTISRSTMSAHLSPTSIPATSSLPLNSLSRDWAAQMLASRSGRGLPMAFAQPSGRARSSGECEAKLSSRLHIRRPRYA